MIFKNLGKNSLINLFLVLSIFLLDRLSKIFVINLDKKFLGTEIFSSKFLNISLIWNKGIAFGLFSFNNQNTYNILTILILLIILGILFIIIKSKSYERYALLMILGGALGNVFDRIIYKGVPDFIDFHIGDFHWFIFNVSDIFITIGVILMIYFEIVGKPKANL
jgi:signal peptidase II